MIVLLTVFLKCNTRTHETETEWRILESRFRELLKPGVRNTLLFQFHKSSSSQLPGNLLRETNRLTGRFYLANPLSQAEPADWRQFQTRRSVSGQ